MKKRMIVAIVFLVGLAGFIIWVLPSFAVGKPVSRMIHIQTPGGPVPIKLVVFDAGWTVIDYGHVKHTNSIKLESGYRGDFQVTNFERSPLLLELEFPRTNATLKVEEVVDDEGKKQLEGYWTQKEENAAVKKLQITQLRSMARNNWFDEAKESEGDEPDRKQSYKALDGLWSLKFNGNRQKAMLELYHWSSASGETQGTIEAEFLSYRTTNRFFSGRVDGDRIRLASFDNGVPVLIHAELQPDGTLKGDLWIGNWEHQSWTATRESDAIDP